ncbi:MAG: type II toxin-antitoxin system HicB family antitoxin [Parcubacteria group bacterium]|nr:type II toxin-antitoxin system HicB family antitoxin [Parcubacteria group bacterium]
MVKRPQQFKAIIEQDEDGYFIGSVPALPGCYTQAKTLLELKKRLQEAILLCLETARLDPQYRQRLKIFSYIPAFVGLESVEV